MLGEWIGEISFARAVINKELALADPVLEPVPPHVHGFGSALFHVAVGKSIGSGVVDLEGDGRLGVTKFGKSGADGDGFMADEVVCSDFAFGCGADDDVDDLAECVYWAVQGGDVRGWLGWVNWLGAQEEVGGGTAASASFGQIQGVTVYVQCHVAGGIADDGKWIARCIIHEPVAGVGGVFGGLGLGRSNSPQRW